MKKEYLKIYEALLFNLPQTTPTLKTYAIIDSARDERCKESIILSGLDYVDLWHEEMFELEQQRPLYLVELQKNNPLTQQLLEAHDKSIATYFISPYRLEALKSYYSFFTYVQIEEMQEQYAEAIFGFYDPNILPNYIQTLYNQEKIDEFFAGIAMWLSPSVEKEDELYLAFRSKAGHIDDVNLQLQPLLEEEQPMLNFDDVSFPTIEDLETYVHEIYIDKKQLAVFEEMEKRRFVDKLFEAYQEDAESFYRPEPFNKEYALSLIEDAKKIGLESEGSIYRYVWLGLSITKPLNELSFYQRLLQTQEETIKIHLMDQLIEEIKITQQRSIKDGKE